MVPRTRSQGLRPQWACLPNELRNMILEITALVSYIQGYALSPYAVVCREWQLFFEGHTFRGLHLHQEDLDDFACIVGSGSRQFYVIRLWLDLKLLEY
ncbi:hypothetical protein F5B21DRAFT_494307 [Xylaria acuta]|nr:hypothetical protein F5B21DRAFT_494307 [Xylaria acuta]